MSSLEITPVRSTPTQLLSTSTPPPLIPLRWLWQCHLCRQKYPLGATRRCLEDGHFFCAGVTVVRKRGSASGNSRALVERHIPCSSEFDYHGWLVLREWRRAERSGCEKGGVRDCWSRCSYPSECRWKPHIDSVDPAASIPEVAIRIPQVLVEVSTGEHQNQASGNQKDQRAIGQQCSTVFDSVLKAFELLGNKQRGQSSSMLKENFWSGTPVSAFKHKNSRGKSPPGTIVEDKESWPP